MFANPGFMTQLLPLTQNQRNMIAKGIRGVYEPYMRNHAELGHEAAKNATHNWAESWARRAFERRLEKSDYDFIESELNKL